MRAFLPLLLILGATAAASAQEPVGCDKFAWNLDRERALIATATPAPSGALDRDAGKAVVAHLVPFAEARLSLPPERAPKAAGSFAGVLHFDKAPAKGSYRVTLSGPAWIDVVQNGAYVKSGPFTGALECPNARKSVTFALGAEPFDLQLSDAGADSIALVITPAN